MISFIFEAMGPEQKISQTRPINKHIHYQISMTIRK